MKAVVQRVKSAKLYVDGAQISDIGFGLVVFFCAEKADMADCDTKIALIAKKIANLRIFEDGSGKMNFSVLDTNGEILAVSQFTLCGDVSHGNRPSFVEAMEPVSAKHVYDRFCEALSQYGVSTKRGVFGADMQIIQHNDGPVTIWYDL